MFFAATTSLGPKGWATAQLMLMSNALAVAAQILPRRDTKSRIAHSSSENSRSMPAPQEHSAYQGDAVVSNRMLSARSPMAARCCSESRPPAEQHDDTGPWHP